MQLTVEPLFISSCLIDRVTSLYGRPLIASLPAVTYDGDHAAAFEDLLRQVQQNGIVLFPDIWPGNLDAFFHLRLAQILKDRPSLRALSVVVLAPDLIGQKLAGGFAGRFRSAWPFDRCVFLTDGGDPFAFSHQLGLPVADAWTGSPEILHSHVKAGQKIALQLQIPWGRCGSTTAFENQIQDLVAADFLTIRLFTNGQFRRGPTLDARLEKAIPENSTHAGAHINIVAVPDGPPAFVESDDPAKEWANVLAASASCRICDSAVIDAANRADSVIANHIETVGGAIRFAPRARLLLDVHGDRAVSTRNWMLNEGESEADIEASVAAAARAQARVLALPDICTHASTDERDRLRRHGQRSAIVLPRIYLTAVPASVQPRFDLLLVGDEHVFNIASLRWFLDEVWRPHLEPASVRVAVAGRAGQRLDPTEYHSPLLHFPGFIDDLDTFRSCCRLTVVPDRSGTGISVKMLTTISAGHPLATTPMGLRGLDASIAGLLPAFEDAGALAADILALVANTDLLAQRRALVEQAQDAIQRGPDFSALLRSIPLPSTQVVRRRKREWVSIAAAATQRPKTPFRFDVDTPFQMSGSRWDDQVLIDGWHEAEPWGRWTDGAEASLRIDLAAPINELLRLELDIVPSAAASRLEIAVDGHRFDAVQPLAGWNGWDLPRELTAGKTALFVTICAIETVCPARVGGSPDDRILGTGVSAVRLVSGPAACDPDHPIRIRSDAMPPNVLLSGWHAVEDWGCWSNGETASFQLSFTEPLRDALRLELDIMPSTPGATLTLSVNGCSLPAVVPSDGINRWTLPPETTDGETRLLIVLSVSETYCPTEAGTADDDRTLGVGLRGIKLVKFVPATCVVGQPLPLAPPVDLDDVLLEGWHQPEPWGTWTNGPVATMRLGFGDTLSGSFSLQIEFAAMLAETTVAVTVNACALPPVNLAGGSAVWRLPPACTDGQRELAVALQVANTFCPAAFGVSGDDRILGIGVRSLSVNREAPAVCRIGDTLTVSSRLGDSGMLARGWHRLEPWGCWTAGPEALMSLPFAAPLEGTFALRMNLMPPLLDVAVSLVVNGMALQPLHVVDGVNEWILPRICTEGQTALSIGVHVEHPARPMDVNDSWMDDRLLGVAVRSFAVVPLQ